MGVLSATSYYIVVHCEVYYILLEQFGLNSVCQGYKENNKTICNRIQKAPYSLAIRNRQRNDRPHLKWVSGAKLVSSYNRPNFSSKRKKQKRYRKRIFQTDY